MNEGFPDTPTTKRLFDAAAENTPAPSDLWDRVSGHLSERSFRRRRQRRGRAVLAAVACVCLFLAFRPQPTLSSWTLNGQPLALGQGLSARRSALTLAAPGVGTVELQAGSRVRVLESRPGRQRLALESGSLHARVTAPPRLFVVETPAAIATDLGCEYELTVEGGGSALDVQSGYVELAARKGSSVLVPAGAGVLARSNGEVTLPWFGTARAAVLAYDADRKLGPLLQRLQEPMDTLSLFYLLPRVSGAERAAVLDKLLTLATLPGGVTREQVLALDPRSLAAWREKLKYLWGGAVQVGF